MVVEVKSWQSRTECGLGAITVYHFLMDIGMNVVKPDRVLGLRSVQQPLFRPQVL
jgi:hypothetical protein